MLSSNEKARILEISVWSKNTERRQPENPDSIITVAALYGKLLKELEAMPGKNMKYAIMSAKINKEDLLQAGNMGLWNALNTYDSKKGSSLNTYITKCVNRAMKQANMKLNKESRLDLCSSIEGFQEENDGMELPISKECENEPDDFELSMDNDTIELATFLRNISIVERWNKTERLGLEWLICRSLYGMNGEEFLKKYPSITNLKLCQEYKNKAIKRLNNDVYYNILKNYCNEGKTLPCYRIV